MVVLRLLTLAVTWSWLCAGVVGMAGGQRAPCYQCEMYRETHPHSHPYTAVRAHCVYPCNCGPIPSCGPRTPIIQDGCRCCWQCARQAGEPCDGVFLCDSSKSLTCRYNNTFDPSGVCQEIFEVKCVVNDTTYNHGESFSLDCRTQCTCQNGTYACVSLCPGESLPPSERCHNPHLVSVPGQCCREWMCDTAPSKVVAPPVCERQSGQWSECSSTSCGVGVSVRLSTDNNQCKPENQTRLCQIRACRKPGQSDDHALLNLKTEKPTRKHHIRRGHMCKATLRHKQSVRLRAGWCISERRFRPKTCADCPNKCCAIHTSTTISVGFLCPLHANTDLLAATKPRQVLQQATERSFEDDVNINLSPYKILGKDIGPQRNELAESVLKYPPSVRYFEDFDTGFEEENYLRRVKKNSNYGEDFNSYSNLIQNNYPSVSDQSDNLLEDAPPFEIDNLTVDDDIEYNQIKNDNYETVHHKVQWILRCKCQESCKDQTTKSNQEKSSEPT